MKVLINNTVLAFMFAIKRLKIWWQSARYYELIRAEDFQTVHRVPLVSEICPILLRVYMLSIEFIPGFDPV